MQNKNQIEHKIQRKNKRKDVFKMTNEVNVLKAINNFHMNTHMFETGNQAMMKYMLAPIRGPFYLLRLAIMLIYLIAMSPFDKEYHEKSRRILREREERKPKWTKEEEDRFYDFHHESYKMKRI